MAYGNISKIEPLDFMQYGISDLQHFTFSAGGKLYYVFPKKGLGNYDYLRAFQIMMWTVKDEASPFALLNRKINKHGDKNWSYSKVLDIKSPGELPTYLEQHRGGTPAAKPPETPAAAPAAPDSIQTSLIDELAETLEKKGLIKEAYTLDVISNTLDHMKKGH